MTEPEKRPRGRPRMPDTTVVNLRISRALLERLDRYIDSQARGTRTDINRATVTRTALEMFISEKGDPYKNIPLSSVVKYGAKNRGHSFLIEASRKLKKCFSMGAFLV